MDKFLAALQKGDVSACKTLLTEGINVNEVSAEVCVCGCVEGGVRVRVREDKHTVVKTKLHVFFFSPEYNLFFCCTG